MGGGFLKRKQGLGVIFVISRKYVFSPQKTPRRICLTSKNLTKVLSTNQNFRKENYFPSEMIRPYSLPRPGSNNSPGCAIVSLGCNPGHRGALGWPWNRSGAPQPTRNAKFGRGWNLSSKICQGCTSRVWKIPPEWTQIIYIPLGFGINPVEVLRYTIFLKNFFGVHPDAPRSTLMQPGRGSEVGCNDEMQST